MSDETSATAPAVPRENRNNRLRARLALAEHEQRGILMGFLPAGFPDPAGFTEAAHAAFHSGMDALEVSMPGPAPDLDGPLIQEAAIAAAPHFTDFREGLALAAAARSHDDDAVIALAYARHIDSIGALPFLDAVADADVDGILLPQEPVTRQLEIGAEARARGIEPVIFLHLEQDLPVLCKSTFDEPFIYLQSADLHTGGRFHPAKAVERLRELDEALGGKSYRVAVGFGVRGPEEVSTVVRGGADGAIVGTRLVAAAREGAEAVAQLVDDIRPALFLREDQNA